MKALISGAGIGGLSAAICLARAGWEVRVQERAAALTEVGAGVQLSPNATRVLRAMGALDGLAETAYAPDALELRWGPGDRRIFRLPMASAAEDRWGAPYLTVLRADLVEVLRRRLEALAPGALRLGDGIESATPDGTARLASGAGIAADLVVGADGLHSELRAHLHGRDAPRFTGVIAWRCLVEARKLEAPPPPGSTVWAGPGRHAVTTWVAGGEIVNFAGLVESDERPQERWDADGDPAGVRADFAGFCPRITALLARAEGAGRWALYDRAPLPFWSRGRLTLLGDAAHPMLPSMAQGACQAIEDAYVLADCLPPGADVERGLAAYEARRRPRTAWIQRGSARDLRLFHAPRAMAAVKYAPFWLAGQLAPGLIRARQDRLYGHDVTRT